MQVILSSLQTIHNCHSAEIELAIENFMLSLGTLLVIDTDPKFSLTPPFIRYLSEVAFIQLGDASITGVPGELYPEIAVGGIENPAGADYIIDPQEVPHLRSQFPDKLNMMVNLANDSIGYIIQKSEWDEDALGYTERKKKLMARWCLWVQTLRL